MTSKRLLFLLSGLLGWVLCAALPRAAGAAAHPTQASAVDAQVIRLRAWGAPTPYDASPASEATRQVLAAFIQRYPGIEPVSPTGLLIPGGARTMDMVPLMQIAGDIAPDVLYVNFRQSHTYIAKNLLYPLDRYVESLAGVSLPDGSAMATPAYLEALSRGRGWERIRQRVPAPCWAVMRRQCPEQDHCRHRKAWGLPAIRHHQHVWMYPIGSVIVGLEYDRALLAEHRGEGLEIRAPRDWEELIRWAKVLTHPQRNEFGMRMAVEVPAWQYFQLLYAAGGNAVAQNQAGDWVCTLDSEAAVEAAYFYARLRLERIVRGDRVYRGVTSPAASFSGAVRFGMVFTYLDERFLLAAQDQTRGFGPVPAGPGNLRRSEFNAAMCGIFSGLESNPRRRDAAWTYIEFYDSQDARRIRTESFVDAGLGAFVRPALLRQFNADGQYDDILRQVPPELDEVYRISLEGGVPEPYGKNCQHIYTEVNKPLGAILSSPIVVAAIDAGEPERGKAEIRRILHEANQRINQKMLGNLPAPVERRRQAVAWTVIVAVVLIFIAVFRQVYRTFRAPASTVQVDNSRWRRRRYRWAYILLAPALLSIGLWAYWPLVRGTLIAFQDYSVTGQSVWVGAANFADVLFDPDFWFSLRVSLTYALLYLCFGFGAPIALALLLQEVPRGSIVYRTLFYLPAVLSGVVVLFLWKSFYAPEGLINQILNAGITLLNYLPGVHMNLLTNNWLDNPTLALFFCLLPIVWAGMGPGCLIYLAAFKTIPEELYEAADLDGAGIRQKVFRVALPSIAALVSINFIGAMIGAIRGAGGFMLAMTGGGPYGQSGGATEVIGLKLFYTTFGRLDFGQGAAMAWVLGSMLIGFTVVQLRRLKNMEFRTAEKTK